MGVRYGSTYGYGGEFSSRGDSCGYRRGVSVTDFVSVLVRLREAHAFRVDEPVCALI